MRMWRLVRRFCRPAGRWNLGGEVKPRKDRVDTSGGKPALAMAHIARWSKALKVRNALSCKLRQAGRVRDNTMREDRPR